jgi:hypothetical protein
MSDIRRCPCGSIQSAAVFPLGAQDVAPGQLGPAGEVDVEDA